MVNATYHSNCYVVGTDIPTGMSDSPREAILIDPSVMDLSILDSIEGNDYALRGVLITHDHETHVEGLRTLRRIYSAAIYGVKHVIMDFEVNRVQDGDVVEIGPFSVEVISVPGHSSDSVVYKIDNVLFTGDVLSAGFVGSTVSSSSLDSQVMALRTKIFSLPGNMVVFPGHGPPTSIDMEKRCNLGIEEYEQSIEKGPFGR